MNQGHLLHTVGPINSGAAVGGAGVAPANASSAVRVMGRLRGIYVKYKDAPPAATTDVTIKTVGGNGAPPSQNLLVLTNAATDGWFYPAPQLHTTAGALIAGEDGQLLVDDLVNVKIDQANANDNIGVWLVLE